MSLGNYPAVVAAFKKALPTRSGVVAVQDTVPLIVAYLKAGEESTAIRYAETVLTLAENVRSKRVINALNSTSSVLAVQKDSTAQDLARQIAAVSAYTHEATPLPRWP